MYNKVKIIWNIYFDKKVFFDKNNEIIKYDIKKILFNYLIIIINKYIRNSTSMVLLNIINNNLKNLKNLLEKDNENKN